jgi:hypothetical protein
VPRHDMIARSFRGLLLVCCFVSVVAVVILARVLLNLNSTYISLYPSSLRVYTQRRRRNCPI